jgi:hypothetical protein
MKVGRAPAPRVAPPPPAGVGGRRADARATFFTHWVSVRGYDRPYLFSAHDAV